MIGRQNVSVIRDLVVADSTYKELAKVDVATDFRRRSGKTVDECPPQEFHAAERCACCWS